MTPTPEEKAKQLYRDAYMRWSYEPSYDKNYLMAKAIADYVVEEILKARPSEPEWLDWSGTVESYWLEVKQEIQKL